MKSMHNSPDTINFELFLTFILEDTESKSGFEEIVLILAPLCPHSTQSRRPFQVIEYNSHQPLSKYLHWHHSNPRFDVILECRGVYDVYIHCANYLTPKGLYVTVGPKFASYTLGGVLFTVFQTTKISLSVPGHNSLKVWAESTSKWPRLWDKRY